MTDFLRNIEGHTSSSEFRVPVTGTSEPGIVVITAPVLRHAVEQVLKEAEAKRDRLIAKFESM